MSTTLERTTFSTSRLMEFFSEKELSMQIGHGPDLWPLALTKELIDNALDACETAGTAPEITVTVEPDAVAVQDNGPGLPADTLRESLDYTLRVSDKLHYVSPTRGQLGNALKCVWAAPYVADGERGLVQIITGGEAHRIEVTLDRIAGKPHIDHSIRPDGDVKTGTLVRIHWNEIASYLADTDDCDSYKLGRGYAMFNPHLTLSWTDSDGVYGMPATDKEWRKWRPDDPTSPHWYTPEDLRGLIAAYIDKGRNAGTVQTVREFVAEFRGLAGTRKQKTITDATGLTSASLDDMVVDGDVDGGAVERLLKAMQAESREVKPAKLGTIGKDHLSAQMASLCHVDPESVRYVKKMGYEDGLPYVWEMAFGVYTEKYQGCRAEIITGLNWAPTLKIPIAKLSSLLGEMRVDWHDPVVVVVHLASPRLKFTDRGKSALDLS